MAKDILTMCVIYLMQLAFFSIFASMAFYQIAEFDGLYLTSVYLFNATFGNYEFSIFDVYEPDFSAFKYLGHLFMFCFLFMNLLIFLNMVVAKMSNSYALMMSFRQGIYNYEIMRALPIFRMNKYYGGIIAMTPPFNLLCMLVAPLFIKWRNNYARLKTLTKLIMVFNYSVHLLLTCVIFISCNLVLAPLAYFRTVVTKFLLV